MNTSLYNFQLPDERVDGLDKVTGKARYTAEHQIPNMAYAVFICSTITKGSVKNIDSTNALNVPGALRLKRLHEAPSVDGEQHGHLAAQLGFIEQAIESCSSRCKLCDLFDEVLQALVFILREHRPHSSPGSQSVFSGTHHSQ